MLTNAKINFSRFLILARNLHYYIGGLEGNRKSVKNTIIYVTIKGEKRKWLDTL